MSWPLITTPLIILLLLSLVSSFVTATATAEEGIRFEEFKIFSDERIERVYGLVLQNADDASTEKINSIAKQEEGSDTFAPNVRTATAERLAVRVWAIKVQTRPEDYGQDRKLTVVGFTNSGEIVSSEVRHLGANDAKAIEVALNCPPLEIERDYGPLLALDNKKLAALAGIRKRKEEVLIKFIREYLDSDVILRLQELERKYNLIHQNKITAQMSLQELLKRVAILDSFAAAK